MATQKQPEGSQNSRYVAIAIELILKVGALFLLVFLSYKILQPFLGILVWGLIIGVVLFPLFEKLNRWFGGRKKLASLLLTLVSLSVLVLPSIWLVTQLVDGVKLLAGMVQRNSLGIPAPSEDVADWPLIGDWLYGNWLELHQNFGESIKEFLPQFSEWIEPVLGAMANTGLGILQFAASIVLAGVFLVFFEYWSVSGRKVFKKIAGERGEEFLEISLLTIRNVATGVLGVAVIQTTVMGVGLILAEVPLAAVWIIVLLIMTIAQIPALIFNVFLIIYLFAFRDPLPAALWSVYFLVMGLIDNFLKPLFMGQGASVPMLVIFLGAIGGFLAFSFIGLFLGSILLSLAYKIYVTWVALE